MDNTLIVSLCVVVFLTLVVVHIIMRSRHPFRSAVLSLVPGVIALLCVNLTVGYTGVSIPVSPLSLSVAAVLGIPGVTCLLLLQRIF